MNSIEPNPNTDDEMHYFTYSLYPHQGSWQEAGTVREAAKLNSPAYALQGGEAGDCYSFASVDKANVILETVKKAEDSEAAVLRLYESENARTKVTVTLPAETQQVFLANLLEEQQQALELNGNKVTFTIKPFEIVTLLVY